RVKRVIVTKRRVAVNRQRAGNVGVAGRVVDREVRPADRQVGVGNVQAVVRIDVPRKGYLVGCTGLGYRTVDRRQVGSGAERRRAVDVEVGRGVDVAVGLDRGRRTGNVDTGSRRLHVDAGQRTRADKFDTDGRCIQKDTGAGRIDVDAD